ncbi:MAG: PLDc N-terminal domain-containing protein, partial [Pirellula sp.]
MRYIEWVTLISVLIHFAIQFSLCMRVILRPHRDPASRIAWLVFILAVPLFGIVAYILLGDISIGRNRIARMDHVVKSLPKCHDIPGMRVKEIQPRSKTHWDHLFQVGQSINGFEAIGGNHGKLLPDSYFSIDAMVADIDA